MWSCHWYLSCDEWKCWGWWILYNISVLHMINISDIIPFFLQLSANNVYPYFYIKNSIFRVHICILKLSKTLIHINGCYGNNMLLILIVNTYSGTIEIATHTFQICMGRKWLLPHPTPAVGHVGRKRPSSPGVKAYLKWALVCFIQSNTWPCFCLSRATQRSLA